MPGAPALASVPEQKRARTRGKRPSVADTGRVVDAGVSGALADALAGVIPSILGEETP